jgi:peptide-methionine (S)-S-oxide reductase
MLFGRKKTEMVDPTDALPGRAQPAFTIPTLHEVTGAPIQPPFAPGLQTAIVGMGCFWGAERRFWTEPGVVSTAAGYAGGFTPHPTYEETCTNKTGHAEVVLVVFDPARVSYERLLRVFWEEHDPTQGMRQGADVGTTYRSAIYATSDDQLAAAIASREAYQRELTAAGYGEITTEIAPAGPFYYAEPEHQQYLHKNPWGYCGLQGTGVGCPVRLIPAEPAAS